VKILLTGRNGQVGWELERALPALGEVIATDRAALDLADPDAIRRVVRQTKPDVIVNAGAYTAVDKAESESDLAMQINGVGPGVLGEEAKRLGALLVHYSTDYVFDGAQKAPYREDGSPNPLNVYGKTKLEGEQRIAQSGARHLLLRTSWVYAPRGKNFFLTIANKATRGEPLRVVNDQRGAPTEASFIADISCKLLERSAEGTFNVTASGEASWHEFASAIVTRLGARTSLQAVPSSAYPSATRRPAYSVLDLAKVSRALGVPPPAWPLLLDHCVKEWTRS
jgi:dTDP-4-dehydrorhamnose reductase